MFDKVSDSFLDAIKSVMEAKKTNKHGHDVVGKEDDDIDNDGDVDKSDKYLHNRRRAIGKAMMKKEEAQIDELSTPTLRKYREKARDDAFDADAVDDERRLRKRSFGHNQAGKKIIKRGDSLRAEEAEQIDELSKGKLAKYIGSAEDSADELERKAIKGDDKSWRKMHKRLDSTLKAKHKWIHAKEEAEQIDELSKKTLGSYVKKAAGHAAGSAAASAAIASSSNPKVPQKVKRDLRNRMTGISKATDRLTKEEIEMIEAKLAGVAKGSMEDDKHMCATKVFHKEWAEGTPIKTMHADPDENGLIEWYDVMFDHGIERVMTEDMEILQAESHMHSKKMKEEAEELDELSRATIGRYAMKAKSIADNEGGKDRTKGRELAGRKKWGGTMSGVEKAKVMATEEAEDLDESVAKAADHLIKRYGDNVRKSHVRSAANDLGVGFVALSHHVRKKLGVNRLEEARGRPKKQGSKDFTVHPVTKEKLMHNNPEHMKKIERLQKHGVLEKPKREADQHIMNQLQKAKTSMRGGETIHFTHGESKHVSGSHAAKLLSKYAEMKPSEKEDFQKKIGHSHEQLMKHV
jgi:hypothetical protein